MTYDLNGALRRKWVTNPFYFFHIAVDRGGNVDGLGVRLDGMRVSNLVRKYSPDGAVKAEFFPASLAASGQDSLFSNAGDNERWIDGDRLRAYMAESDELFEFDLGGKLQRRTSLRDSLIRLARDHDGARAEVVTLAGDGQDSGLLAQVRIWIEGDEDLSFACARLFLDGRRPRTLEAADGTPLATPSFPLRGRIGNDVLFLNRCTAAILRR